MRTPDYKIIEDYEVRIKGSNKTIPAWSFVRPISDNWVPAHIIEDDDKASFIFKHNKENDCYCYTHYGIVSIPRRLLIKV